MTTEPRKTLTLKFKPVVEVVDIVKEEENKLDVAPTEKPKKKKKAVAVDAAKEEEEKGDIAAVVKPKKEKSKKQFKKKPIIYKGYSLTLYELLRKHYPVCFDYYKPAPFAKNILWDLLRETPKLAGDDFLLIKVTKNRTLISNFVAHWCGRVAYLKACKAGAIRYGLDGVANGIVSEQEAKWAASRLKKVQELIAVAKKQRLEEEVKLKANVEVVENIEPTEKEENHSLS